MKRESAPAPLPEGFAYHPDLVSEAEERELLCRLAGLPFHPFEFHGYIAKRRIVAYGLDYDFGSRKTSAAETIPGFLLPLRERAGQFAAVAAEALVEAVVTEYPPGAPIGWHRDVPQFEVIIGISLGASCRMRFKPYKAEGKLVSVVLEPRSAYLMRDAARWKYQHSIPAVEGLRYSITFRTLRDKSAARRRTA